MVDKPEIRGDDKNRNMRDKFWNKKSKQQNPQTA
jgi:hypothetical protein